jgi:hypothetical protein
MTALLIAAVLVLLVIIPLVYIESFHGGRGGGYGGHGGGHGGGRGGGHHERGHHGGGHGGYHGFYRGGYSYLGGGGSSGEWFPYAWFYPYYVVACDPENPWSCTY